MRAEMSDMRLFVLLIAFAALTGCDPKEPEETVPEYVKELERQGHRVARPPDMDRHRDVQDDVGRRMRRADPWPGERMQGRSLYVPIRDHLRWDVGTLFRSLHDCAAEKCHKAITSEDQDYLIEQLHQLCRIGDYGALPSPGMTHLYLYVDESRLGAARDAILPCRQHVVIVDRVSKRTLAVLEPEDL